MTSAFLSVAPGGGTDLCPLTLPERYNYVAAFLTLACNYRCSYCINYFGDAAASYPTMSGDEWLRGLNRLVSRPDLPVTLQGGEPSLHRDFHRIINGLRRDLGIDILTNLQFDVEEFVAQVPASRVSRKAPYASIRVSYHPEVMLLDDVTAKVLRLMQNGYSVGIWAVQHPRWKADIDVAAAECREAGIGFRLKEFLGPCEGRLCGTYRYPDAVSGEPGPPVECRTSELIIGPSGGVFRCHSDLYHKRAPIGHLCDPEFRIDDVFRPCESFGTCNPCDIKVKTNRFQHYGHTSVEIRSPAGRRHARGRRKSSSAPAAPS